MAQAAAIDTRKRATTSAVGGLTSAEARRRLAVFGPNTVSEEVPPRWKIFLAKFWGPIPWMLEAAIILQIGLGAYIETAVIGGLLLFNATLGFIQEGRAGAALAALKQRLAPTALVCRDGEWRRVSAVELVPGDAIRLSLGALVPADARLVSGSVMIDQSMLTGESLPVDAGPGSEVYAGSLVRRGQAIAEVIATGAKTNFGRTAELVRVAHAASTEQAAVFAVTRNLAIVNGTVAALIIAYAYVVELPAADQIRLGLTALLATMPLALPATFALSAALSTQVLAARGVLLTRLSAAHEAAAMDVLCADKTGTLTRNALQVADVVAMPGFARERVLALAALASSEGGQDLIDAAVRAAAKAAGRDTTERLVRFIPFDPQTKTSEAFPVVPGQKVLANVLAQGFAQITSTTITVDGQPVTFDNLGRAVITAGGPGRMVVRATATDADGLTSTTETILKIKNPDDTAAPIIAFDGSVNGGVIAATSAIRATILDLDLDHWTLEIAHAGSDSFTVLASGSGPLAPSLLPLASLDPSGFSNGFYRLKLTAADVAGRTAVTEAIVEVRSAVKTQQFTTAETDLTVTLDGHVFNLVRQYDSLTASLITDDSSQSFGNGWRLANRDVNLETNLEPRTSNPEPFRLGTRLYLTLPTGERVGYTFAPVQQTVNGVTYYTPAFVADNPAIGYQLSALDVKLTKAGDHFYDFLTGEAYNPANPTIADAQFTLTAPDGTIYTIHAANGITAQQFTDGKKFILSDSGITAVGTGEAIQFIWESSPFTSHVSRLTSVTGPDGHRIVYSYDQQGNLVSARDLISGETSRYGYDAQHRVTLITETGQPGQSIQYLATPGTPSTPQILPVKADLGAAITYLQNPYTSTLAAGATDQLVFSVRPSEINSTNSTDVYLGVIVEAEAGSNVLPGIPTIAGLTAIASNVSGNKAFSLFRIEKEGLELLKIAGVNGSTSGAYSVKLFIAGDANRDGRVDGVDGQLLTDALASGPSPLASALDANQDGVLNATDIHFYRQDLGFIPNQAPVVQPITAAKTHVDLAISQQLSAISSDAEGDPTFYRIVGATNGTARIASDGSSVSFTPTTGFFGTASFSIVADDGYATSQVATVTVNVSDAPLVKLDFQVRQPRLDARHSTKLQLIGDFTDEQNVALPASYLMFQVHPSPLAPRLSPASAVISPTGLFTALIDGSTGVITASTAHGPSGVTLQAATAFSVGIPTDQTQQFLYALGVNVFPGAVSLAANSGQRQIKADLADTIVLTAGSTGTSYFVSNPNVITVSADGLITAGLAGDAIVTVINGPAESLIPVKVQVPNIGPTLIGKEGGIVKDTSGYQVAIAPDALAASTLVSITPVTQGSLPLAMPGPFEYVSSFDLQIGDGRLATPAQLAIPISGSTLAPGSDIVFFRYTTLPDTSGGTFGVWMQEETGVFGADGVARTTSPPFPGVLKSGTWMIGAAPVGSVARVDGKLNTFFPDQGSSFTVVAPMAGASIAQEIHSPFFLLLTAGVLQPLVFLEVSTFGSVKASNSSVLPQLGQVTTFNTTVINQVVDTATSADAPPIIETAQVVMENGEATLILTGSRFTYDKPEAGAALNQGADIHNLLVNFDVPIRPELQFTQEQLGQFIVAGKEIPKTIRITAQVDPSSSGTTARVKVPKGVILGVSDVSVTRKTPVYKTLTRVWEVKDRTSETTRITSDVHVLFVANNFDKTVTAVDVSNDPANNLQPRNQILAQIPVGDPAQPGPTRSVVVTPDLTRAYVTTGSGIAVIDAQTLQEVDVDPKNPGIDHIIEIKGAHPYWAVADKAGNYLYVSDTFVGSIYVIDINPTSQTFHKLVKTISVPEAVDGLRGMDVTADGRRLYVAAPLKGGAAQFSNQQYPNGKILIIDIDTTPGNKILWTKVWDVTVSQEPYFVKASETNSRLVTFTDRRSDPNGFGVIEAKNDAHTSLTVKYASLQLGSRLDNFDVNDASAIAILPAGTLGSTQTKDYAFVTGWNRIQQGVPSRDPFLSEALSLEEQQASGFVLNAPVGGNIGVIEDPFGTPKLIAATAGEFLSMPDGIMLSADGKTLYASFSAQNLVRVFDVQKIFTQITKPQNLVPNQFIRRDGQFTRLEISPLDGPGGIGVNVPLDNSIEKPSIATGRFPQGMALAESLKVNIGFGRTNDAQGGLVINPEAEAGDTTPVIRWKVDWTSTQLRDAATSRLYLSVFPSGQGLFPGDVTDAEGNDLNAHRILTRVQADHTVTASGDVFQVDLGTIEPLRQLTLGQTYYIGIEVLNSNGEVIQSASREFKLKQVDPPANATTFSSVTVLTHGFEPPWESEIPSDFLALGKSIAAAGGGGITATYDSDTGRWRIYSDGADGQLNGQILTASNVSLGKSLVLLPDWINESNISDSGFSEAAADAFFASLVQLNAELGGKVLASPLHLIAHSRGASVNSEIIQRLGTYFPDVRVRMTTLDPHDFKQPALDIPAGKLAEAVSDAILQAATKNKEAAEQLSALLKPFLSGAIGAVDASTIAYAEFLDPNVVRWSNVTFADNYYQSVGAFADDKFTVTPNGEYKRDFDINIQLNGRAGFTQDDFGSFGIGGPHSRVWKWYAGTVDLSLQSFANDQVFRSLADQGSVAYSAFVPTFKYNDRPWYASQEANAVNALTGYSNPEPFTWEGIGEGWAFSPQGGVQLTNLPPTIVLHPVTDNNTEVPKGIDPAVPSIFNGNFEYGNLHPDARYPGLLTRDSQATPGWFFHGGNFVKNGGTVVPDGTGDFAVELTSISGGNSEIVHNRFYIPTTAEFLTFDARIYQRNLQRTGQLLITMTVDGITSTLGSIELQNETAGFAPFTYTIPNSARGKVGTIAFTLQQLVPGPIFGTDRIWLDNIALLTQSGSRNFAPPSPLMTEDGGQPQQVGQIVNSQSLGLVMSAALAQWQGIGLSSMIVPPNGGSGVQLGLLQSPAIDFLAHAQDPDKTSEPYGHAGSSEGGFNDELLLHDLSSMQGNTNSLAFGLGREMIWHAFADQLSINNDPTFASDGHAIQSEPYSWLARGEMSGVVQSIFGETLEPDQVIDGAFEDEGAVGLLNLNIESDLAAPSSQGAVTDLQVLDLNKLSLFPFQPLPERITQSLDFVPVSVFVPTPSLGQGQDQQSQSALQHSLSFGSQTVPTDRNLVNNSEAISQQLSALSLDQLTLLSKATITIADLADGYLALTSGTTITLDTDAAGYGWFVDPTPLMNEEFRATATSPWQFTAIEGSAAAGKIDLMTVLMHELGHVMGLEHVSSAVDGTRLMAGSIDPGIRRLPSSLDLGTPSTQPSAVGTQPSDSSIWDPYLAHYTTTSDATPTTPLTPINPARLVQAAQIPSHQGIFNQNFAITDQQSANFGWDTSGAVSITNGQAVLSEDSNVISTLSQLFTLPAGSTHLRFTLLDANLNSNGANRPPDAFEVALLESGTMTPLAGVVSGLDHTDSLLNIQADGTMFLAPGVTVTPLASSPSPRAWIVDVDLTGLPAGTAARLSFDLLGFGDRTSTVVLDNVLLTNGQPTAAPVAVDDAYTVAEGSTSLVPLASGLLLNDTDTDTPQAGLSAAMVTGPLHGTLSLNADGSFSYVHNGSETLTDSFIYRVSDGINLSNLATVSFTITPTNDAPVIAAIAAQSVEQGRTLTVTVPATDPDDSNIGPESNVLTFSLGADAPAGASIDPSTGVLTWAVARTQAVGFYTITVTVTDAGTPALSASRSVTVEVKELTNTPPTLNPIGPKTVNEESELRFTIAATDLDIPAQTLVYSATGLPAGATFDPTTRELVWTPVEDQGGASYQVTFSVTDGEFSASEIVTITVNEVNVAPVLAPIGAKSVNEESELRFTISATDHDIPTQSRTYSATPLPPGATFTPATGEFVWTPTEAQGPGSYVVTFAVSDGVVTTSEAVTITVGEVNVAPVLGPIGNKTVNEETELRFTISGSDLDDPAQTLLYSAMGLPSGASFDSTTREFVWTPSEEQGPNSYVATFTVTDGVVTTSEAVTITVNEVNIAPVLNAIGPKTVNEETELRFTISGSDVDVPTQTLIFSAMGLPTGANFDPTTREFVWTPTEAQGPGSYQVTFAVTDGVVTTSEAVTITVNEVNIAPVLDPIGPKSVNEQTELRFTISGSDVDDPAQTLVYSATGLPAGATFDSTTREFIWTPTEEQGPGTYNVTFSVTDGVVTTSEAVTISVNEVNVAPVLAPIGPKSIDEETLLQFTISATDIDVPVQTLVYSATSLPAGATFDTATRTFSWTPTEGQGPSTTVVTFSVSDGVATTSEAVTISVTEVNQAPVISLITDRVTKMGAAVSLTVSATDADQPAQLLTYSLGAGAPAGATIHATTGVFTWMPTEAADNSPGQFVITALVSDGVVTSGCSFTITVNQSAMTVPYIMTGTSGNDVITVTELPFNLVDIWINSTHQTVTLAAGREMQVYALDGHDLVNLIGLTRPTYVDGGNGHDLIQGLLVLNTAAKLWLKGGDGFDLLRGGAAIDHLDGGLGNDFLSGGSGNDMLYGREGMDILLGDAGDDRLEGGDGDDVLWGGSGNDTVLGEVGHDILVGGSGNDTMEGGIGNDTIYAGAGNDMVRGGEGDDILLGDSGNDTLQGEAGNDRLAGQGGLDTINGGTGTDQAVMPDAGSPAMVSIETILANDTTLFSAATAAKQAWVTQFVSQVPIDCSIDDDEVISIVLTQAG